MKTKICSTCKKSKSISEFHKNRIKTDGYNSVCKVCRSKYHKKTYNGSVGQKNKLINDIERRRKWKIVHVDLKKMSKCLECDNDDYRVIEFHHRDPKTKLFNISRCYNNHFSDKNLLIFLEEVDKCDTLCANCHRILHWEDN